MPALPDSMARTVWIETPSLSANSCWLMFLRRRAISIPLPILLSSRSIGPGTWGDARIIICLVIVMVVFYMLKHINCSRKRKSWKSQWTPSRSMCVHLAVQEHVVYNVYVNVNGEVS